jgi:hypothetical protein
MNIPDLVSHASKSIVDAYAQVIYAAESLTKKYGVGFMDMALIT